MRNTVHDTDWYIAHDALSLITLKTKEQTKAQVIDGRIYFQRWLLPQNNLNKGTTYHERPIDNSPEFISLDNSLDNDIEFSH